MKHLSDIEIAQAKTLQHIKQIAKKLKVDEDDLEMYGKYKAKLPLSLIDDHKVDKNNLVLVTALTPTPAGEGKTTVSIGLTEGLNKIGKQATVVLREPSLGPVFGIKGGAAGGGYSQVVPMEDINLHFTGDFNAVEKANNLLSALIDNNIQSKTNNLNIDPRTILWKRVIDMNDRSLRDITIGLGGTANGVPRQDGFNITPASEVMAILCMASDIENLKKRLGDIFIGFTFDKKPVFARDLKAENAMAILLKDAIKPNLVQTIEGEIEAEVVGFGDDITYLMPTEAERDTTISGPQDETHKSLPVEIPDNLQLAAIDDDENAKETSAKDENIGLDESGIEKTDSTIDSVVDLGQLRKQLKPITSREDQIMEPLVPMAESAIPPRPANRSDDGLPIWIWVLLGSVAIAILGLVIMMILS